MSIRVLIVARFPCEGEGIKDALGQDPTFEVVGTSSGGDQAVRLARQVDPHVVVLEEAPSEAASLLRRMSSALPGARTLAMVMPDAPAPAAEPAPSAASLSRRAGAEELRRAVLCLHRLGSTSQPRGATDGSPAGIDGGPEGAPALTPRERQIVRLVAAGHTDLEVAERLSISPHTVQSHLGRVREKTGLHRRSEVIRWVVQQGL